MLPRAVQARLRWRALLRSCSFNPDTTEQPVGDLAESDFLIAGCPRSGTSLLAALLFEPPQVVTCVEPWDGLRMSPAQLAMSLRTELADGELRRGRLDVAALDERRAVRWQRDGERAFPVDTAAGFKVGIKWPVYWRYLDHMPNTKFLICVRDPRDVLVSFAETGGRLAQGQDYDVAINHAMNRTLLGATTDPALRRALMWEYINSRIVRHMGRDSVLLVRYERWFEDPAQQWSDIAAFLGLSGGWEPNVELSRRAKDRDPAVAALVAEHCPTAGELGYQPG